MNLLNLLTNLKPKWLLILGLSVGIIILIIMVSISKKSSSSNQLPPSTSSPIPSYPQSSSLFNNLVASPSPSFVNNAPNESFGDPNIGMELKKIYDQKPWLNKLPIVTNSYVIVYDWQKNSIRITLMVVNNPNLTYAQQLTQIKADSVKQLQKIGVDLSKESYYYTFSP